MRIADLTAAALLLLAPCIQAAVLAIDYGAEFTKISLVKPGVPFDVVLDRDSKRKIQSVVGWKRDDRVFGAEGKMAATRFPDTHYPYVKPLLGKSAAPELASALYPNEPTHVNGTVYFPHPAPPSHFTPSAENAQAVWNPTALLAHQISYLRGLAVDLVKTTSGAEPVNQAIVTVPAWWDQAQRRAYRDALELEGLTCLAMISEGTGVALNFAMTRSFPTYDPATGEGSKEYHMIYDSGAMQTTASVLAFYQTSYLPTPKSKTPINTTHIELLGVGWEEVGGVALDLAIREILLRDFEGKARGVDGVAADKRALAKLGREAVRVKQILSANQESNVAIESLYNDIDYRSRLARADFEAAVESQASLFGKPVPAALEAAGLTLDQITSVILFGGNTRVPLVQAALRSALGSGKEDLIAQNVNTDEGAVLGAAFYGAALSRQFKMKNLDVSERSVYDFSRAAGGSGSGVAAEVVFPKGSKQGTKKSILLPAKDDQSLEFHQKGKPVLSVQFVDVAGVLANWTAPSPAVNLTMRLDSRGHLSAASATLVSNVTEKAGGSGLFGGLFGGGKKDEAKAGDDAEAGDDGDAASASESAAAAATASAAAVSKEPKVAVRFREKALAGYHMTGEEKRLTQQRMTSIAAFEQAKASREEARNQLEGYLYRLSALLDPEAENKSLLEYSSPQEQGTMSKLLSETFEWLAEHAEHADEASLRTKRDALEQLERPVIVRFSESQTRFKAVEAFQQAMFAARTFLTDAKANNTLAIEAAAAAPADKPVPPPKYTEAELADVERLMTENEHWMDGLMAEQMKIETDKTQDPVIFTKDLDEKGKALQMLCLRLINKKAPKAPRPPKPSTSASSATTSSTASAAESSSTTTEAEPEPTAPRHEEL